jgi:hypothetical protein
MQSDRHAAPRTPRRRFAVHLLASTIMTMVLAGGASAQDASQAPDSSEPPSLVGRIAAIHGQVSMHRADETDWTDAGINEPLTIGDAIYAQPNGDARVQIGATDIDIRSDSEIDIAALDQDTGRIRLDSGVMDIRVSALPTADGFYILTPRGTVRLTEPGIFRIEAGSEDDPTRVTVWSGAAQLGDASASVSVRPGQMLLISGTPDAPQYAYQGNIGAPPDTWREPSRVIAATAQYIAPDMTGGEDLYNYGSFQTTPDYGAVWYPNTVPADWQPYRDGHWEYVAPWGQTWVDDQPWGFAPFHYGRWAFIGNRWGWCPGEYRPHPVYAPALVAFIGGGGFGASISFGGGPAIGWVPLAPGEAYRPYYRASPRYIENINRTVIVNKTVINNTVVINERDHGNLAGFANRRFTTVAPEEAVARGRPVAQAAFRVRPDQLEHAQIDQKAIVQIRPAPDAGRPRARPGPVAPPTLRQPASVNARPLLPPAHGGGPMQGGNRPDARPFAPRPDQPAMMNRPAPGRPAPVNPGSAQLENRPMAGRPANGGPPPAPPPPRPGAPNRERPAVDRPGVDRPGIDRPLINRQGAQKPPADRPGAEPRPPARTEPARPESRPSDAPRPERPRQAAPRPEPHPDMRPQQQTPRPQPQQAPRPQPRPQPQSAPRPEPRQQQPVQRPQPAPQRAAPPAPRPATQAAPAKTPPKPGEPNHN